MAIRRVAALAPLLIGAPAIELARSRLSGPGPRLVDALRRELPAVLVEDQRRRRSLSFDDESDLLRRDEPVEILALARGQQPPLGPAGELRKQLVAFARDGDDTAGVQLVIADIAF